MKTLARSFAGALLCIAALASPAHGGQTVSATVVSPNSGDVLTGIVNVTVRGNAPTGVERLEILIDGTLVLVRKPSRLQQEVEITYAWNTNLFPASSQIAPNGHRQVTARATATSGDVESKSIGVLVDNPPQSPSGVQATVDDGMVEVEWLANPEPDITGYIVERDSGDGFAFVVETQELSFIDAPSAGTHNYRVSAVRASPVNSDGNRSVPSATATAVISAPEKPNDDTPDDDGPSGDGDDDADDDADDRPNPLFAPRDPKPDEPVKVGGRPFAVLGLPSGPSLPGMQGLPDLPAMRGPTGADEDFEWGTYEEDLPYGVSGADLEEFPTVTTVAARSPDRLLPPDGLRWVAAGLLLLAISLLLRVLAYRVAPPVRDELAL